MKKNEEKRRKVGAVGVVGIVVVVAVAVIVIVIVVVVVEEEEEEEEEVQMWIMAQEWMKERMKDDYNMITIMITID